MDLEGFKLRLAERVANPLAKSTHADDFKAIVQDTDDAGREAVDHTADLSAHPRSLDDKVKHYRDAISNQSPLLRRTPMPLTGVTSKAVYTLPSADKMPATEKVIVKPYHEKLNPKANFWQHHPIQGWAEMTNQSLWYAADMGHMHQKVHVSEHAMSPLHPKEPGIAIHMDPSAELIRHMGPSGYSIDMHDDLPKIAAMDFLSNNLDRHAANLMFLPKGSVNRDGQPLRSRLLAIDHGRSFQYHASNKGAPRKIHDPLLGTVDVPHDAKVAHETEGKTGDTLLNYVESGALNHVGMLGEMFGRDSIKTGSGLFPPIAKWWPTVRNRIVDAMNRRILSLREPRMQQHIQKNFMERVKLLDNIARNPDWYTYLAQEKDLKIPLHIWDRNEKEEANP